MAEIAVILFVTGVPHLLLAIVTVIAMLTGTGTTAPFKTIEFIADEW